MYYLYKKEASEQTERTDTPKDGFLSRCTIQTLKPKPFSLCAKGEKVDLKSIISRLYFWLITFGEYKIFYLWFEDVIVHTSYVIPKCKKFPFMNAGDYEIGPCHTNPKFRRKGSYYFMLEYITALAEDKKTSFFMIVGKTNEASIKGIEKAGFVRCGTVKKNRFKNYCVES